MHIKFGLQSFFFKKRLLLGGQSGLTVIGRLLCMWLIQDGLGFDPLHPINPTRLPETISEIRARSRPRAPLDEASQKTIKQILKNDCFFKFNFKSWFLKI